MNRHPERGSSVRPDRVRRQVMSNEEASRVADELEALREVADWLRSMDDPEDVIGRAERQRVTLTEIIRRASQALFQGEA